MLRFELRVVGGVFRLGHFRPRGGVEEERRGGELEEGEDHGPDEEDEELHRHFDHAVDQHAEPALLDRLAGEIALHLRLVAAEVRQRHQQAADEARPEVVRRGQIERKVDGVQPPHAPGHVQRVDDADVVGQRADGDGQSDGHAAQSDEELVHVRPAHRLRAADGDGDDQQADADVGEVDVPAQEEGPRWARKSEAVTPRVFGPKRPSRYW